MSSKRRRGFPSETRVKRGERIVHGEKELIERLGRNDLCPCGSGRRFQAVLHDEGGVRWVESGTLLSGSEGAAEAAPFDFIVLGTIVASAS